MESEHTHPHNDIISAAQEFCIEQKKRLTAPRMAVIKIIAASPQPLGGYDVLEKLRHFIKSPKPPTAYRAIDFWLKNGFIHRIESLSAYVICRADHRHTGGQFMVCNDCGTVVEAHICKLPKVLKDKAVKNTFAPSSWHVEIHGLCAHCQPA